MPESRGKALKAEDWRKINADGHESLTARKLVRPMSSGMIQPSAVINRFRKDFGLTQHMVVLVGIAGNAGL